jgi:Family of unknown function (DUF6335)
MARRKGSKRKAAARSGRKPAGNRRSAGRAGTRKTARRSAKAAPKKRTQTARRASGAKSAAAKPRKVPRLDRARRTLQDDTVLTTPPSSLAMNRKGSAARTGRAELDQSRRAHRSMTPEIAGGDVDVDVEDAYFTGEEAPGGDNPTPDQDVVDDIGKALGVEYADNEELKSSDKVVERDKHRWELDPASAEDYKDRT